MGNSIVRPDWLPVVPRKKRNGRRSQPQKNRHARPLAWKYVLKSQRVHIPLHGALRRRTMKSDVVDLFQLHSQNAQGRFRIGTISVWIGWPVTSMSLSPT